PPSKRCATKSSATWRKFARGRAERSEAPTPRSLSAGPHSPPSTSELERQSAMRGYVELFNVGKTYQTPKGPAVIVENFDLQRKPVALIVPSAHAAPTSEGRKG